MMSFTFLLAVLVVLCNLVLGVLSRCLCRLPSLNRTDAVMMLIGFGTMVVIGLNVGEYWLDLPIHQDVLLVVVSSAACAFGVSLDITIARNPTSNNSDNDDSDTCENQRFGFTERQSKRF